MAMPVITSLLHSGEDVRVGLHPIFRPLLECFALTYNEQAEGVRMTPDREARDHQTERWLAWFGVNPMPFEHSIPKREPIALISPDASASTKQMPLEFWIDAVSQLRDANLEVAIIGPMAARPYNASLNAHLGVDDWTGIGTMQDLYSQIVSAPVVLTTDTGTSHLADALAGNAITAFTKAAGGEEMYRPFWHPRVVKHAADIHHHLISMGLAAR